MFLKCLKIINCNSTLADSLTIVEFTFRDAFSLDFFSEPAPLWICFHRTILVSNSNRGQGFARSI